MTKEEYKKEIESIKACFKYCVATHNGIEAKKLVIELKQFIKKHKDDF